jgi:prephenate dehydrogenase
MTTCIIGLGLIGGSMALALKKHKLTNHIIGVDNTPEHIEQALQLGLIDSHAALTQALTQADLVIVAIPVNNTVSLLPKILDTIKPSAAVFDMGSTKQNICNAIAQHKNRQQFVATHPMWGTENSGPKAAENNAFINKAVVICQKENSSAKALQTVEHIYKTIGMHTIYMQAQAHDLHTAYISHISHITSFALANTVLEKEREEETIFELASGGFESTVRLAKSNANMWVPIFMQNKDNVLDVLNEHITQLKKFKSCLEKDNHTYLFELIEKANGIKAVLENK